MRGCEAVVHLATASGSTPQQKYLANTTMTINVFHAATDLGARQLIYASSVQVFSGDRQGKEVQRRSCLHYLPLNGDVPPHPRNAYAAGKEAGEELLRYYGRI